MPRARTAQVLGDVLTSVIGNLGLQKKLDEVRAVEAWAMMAGPQINGVTDKAWVRGGKLYVRITSAPWRNELHMRRSQWCCRLNEQLGEPIVREIVFR